MALSINVVHHEIENRWSPPFVKSTSAYYADSSRPKCCCYCQLVLHAANVHKTFVLELSQYLSLRMMNTVLISTKNTGSVPLV